MWKGAFLAGDFFFFTQPTQHFASELLQKGTFPFWNPYAHLGSPFAANWRLGLFYPPALLYRFLGIADANQIFLLLHAGFAGLFAFLLGRSLGLGRGGSFLLSVCLACNGFFFLHGAYFNQTAAISWLPAVFLSAGNPWLLAGTLGLQALAGNPFFAYAAALFVLAALAVRPPAGATRLRACLVWAGGSALAAAISAVQAVPFFAAVSDSSQTLSVPLQNAVAFSEPPRQILRFLFVPLWNWSGEQAAGDPTITGYYMGLAALALAVRGMFSRPGRSRWFWAAGLAVPLALSLGEHLPGYSWLRAAVPGLRFFRFPAQWLFLAAFSTSVLAAMGLDSLRSSAVRMILTLLVAAELLAFASKNPMGIAGRDFFRGAGQETREIMREEPPARITHLESHFGLGDGRLSTAEDWAMAREALLPNLSVPVHLDSAGGYGLIEPKGKAVLFRSLKGNPGLWSRLSGSNARMIYLPSERPRIARWAAAPRARVYGPARTAATDGASLTEILRTGFDPDRELVVTGGFAEEDGRAREGPARALFPDLRTENAMRFTLPPLKGNSWLYAAESFSPGWRAWVDGSETEVFRADLAFRAVRLPENSKNVWLLYRPAAFFKGLAATFAGLLILSAPIGSSLQKRLSSIPASRPRSVFGRDRTGPV
ncbi:MAG: hypothetical protein A2902_03905 [Elusimicrobia bacterium RIFCSPLOWO2_01_FULL_64_13]|nr:MAG: hypothetical protein A2902_03905 [Elusimicrobia bacterium RIFCSPLOWO2_01_FULL_64_13]